MPSMTWTPYTGAAYYKVRYGTGIGLCHDATERRNQTAICRVHLRGPDAPAEHVLLVCRGIRRRRRLARHDARSFDVHDQRRRYHAARPTTWHPIAACPLDPCPAEADTPTLSWERGSERRLVRSHHRERRQLHQPDPASYGTSYTTPDAPRVAPRQSVEPGLLLVRPAVCRRTPARAAGQIRRTISRTTTPRPSRRSRRRSSS